MVKENTIEFIASEAYVNANIEYPVPIKTNIPNWFKKLKHTPDNLSVKGCMPFLDTLTTGYLLKTPQDFFVKCNENDLLVRPSIKCNFNLFKDNLDNINTNLTDFQKTSQIEGSYLINKNNGHNFWKLSNPWKIKTPIGYSCLFLPPLNNTDQRFEIIPGIVDTDTHPTPFNFPVIFKSKNYDGIIEKGTPYVQVIPFKREKWKMKVKKLDEQKFTKDKFFMQKFIINNYKKKYWNKKSFK